MGDAHAPCERACVVVAMYNEAAVVAGVVAGLRRAFPLVICVDDGSADASAALAGEAGAVVLRHPTNLGQGAALQTGLSFGLRHTDAAYFVTFDADGQHRVSDAVAMVAHAESTGSDVVLGTRFADDSTSLPPLRRAVLRAAARFERVVTGLEVSDAHNGLRVLSRHAAERLRLTQPGMAHASELLHLVARHGLDYTEHPVTIDYTTYSRAKGQSSVNALNILYDLVLARVSSAP